MRIVYDGPPMAGKTTSLRTLAAKLGSSLQMPAEIDGRTIYFDWLDDTGGLFEGRRIHCQIVSVPGQASLASRRRALLETADAVVFVSDTTRDGVKQGRSYLRAARAALGGRAGPPVGVVLQANKRDHIDAIPLDEVRTAFDAPDAKVAIVESVATDGSGVHEAFVFAVRLALDRAREGGKLELATVTGLRHTQLQSVPSLPDLPRADLPWGMIWPPVKGRLILHEATRKPPSLRQEPNGDWCSVDLRGWWIQSPAHAEFRSLSAARSAMLEWARAHSAHAGILGGRRCIALSEDGIGHYRLWQCVSISTTLRDHIEQALSRNPVDIAETLMEAARALLFARTQWQGAIPARIDTVTLTRKGPQYARLMPYPFVADQSRASGDLLTFLCAEFAWVRDRLSALTDDLTAVLALCAQRSSGMTSKPDPAASLINFLLRA